MVVVATAPTCPPKNARIKRVRRRPAPWWARRLVRCRAMRLGFAAWIVALAACGAHYDANGGSVSHEPTPPADEPPNDAGVGIDPTADANVEPETPGPNVSYAAAIQRSVHNSYERLEPLLDLLVYHRVRSIELDIHSGKAGATAANGEWFVYHDDMPFFRDTSCESLTDCLGQLAAFHRAFPRHEVVTLWVDLKEPFSSGHGTAELDALLSTVLGRANLFAPEDAKKKCAGATTLRSALAGSCMFPTLDELRGKIIVAVTGGSACEPASPVMTYDGSIAFRAPNHSASCTPSQGDAVFVNLAWDERAQAVEAGSLGLVTRMYKGGVPGGLDSKDDFDGAIAAGALHAATDKANAEVDGWSSTHDVRGFPFRCQGCEGHVEPGTAAIIGLRATSGDLEGNADSGFFAFVDPNANAANGADDFRALVSVPSSHVQEFAKGCLVARASDSPGAAYAAVCRTFDNQPPRMQVRATEGGPTSNTTAPPITGLAVEVPAFLRLFVEPTGAKTRVTAETSGDGKTWVAMGTTDVDGSLPMRGLVVSSHDDGPRKAMFADVRRNGAPLPFTALTKKIAIGAGASGDAFTGVAP